MPAFSIWAVNIYWYGLFYFITCLIWYWFLWRVGQQKRFEDRPWVQKLLTKWIDDLILRTILWVLVWWRLWHVFLYDWAYYSQHIWEIFAVWKWGMSFIGWIIWVIIAIFYVEKSFRLNRKELFIVFDLLLLVIPIWIVLWRIGNFLNQELYWIIVPESLMRLKYFDITHIYTKVDSYLRFNTNFIAAFLEWLVTWIIWITILFKQLRQKKRQPGSITISFIFVYSVARFMIEFLREDSSLEYVWPLTTTQRFMVLFLIFGFVLRHFYKKD